MKTIGICSDHAGFELKQYIKGWLETKGWEYKDFGTYTTESCDYADFAHPLALAVEAGECYPGIAICGSGEGISMTLNKHQGIRAALCWTAEIAHLVQAAFCWKARKSSEEKAGGSAKFTGKYRWSSRPRRIPSIQCRRSKPGFWKLFGIRE